MIRKIIIVLCLSSSYFGLSNLNNVEMSVSNINEVVNEDLGYPSYSPATPKAQQKSKSEAMKKTSSGYGYYISSYTNSFTISQEYVGKYFLVVPTVYLLKLEGVDYDTYKEYLSYRSFVGCEYVNDESLIKKIFDSYEDNEGQSFNYLGFGNGLIIKVTSPEFSFETMLSGMSPKIHDSYYKCTYYAFDTKFEDGPEIDGGGVVRMQNSKTLLSQEQLLEGITANDEYDGDLTNQIRIVEDNYTANYNVPGNYTVTYEVSDSSGNKATAIVTIKVYEDLAPIINVNSKTYTSSYKVKLDFEEIINNITITDDYTIEENLITNIDRGGYEENWNIVGEYTITITATDSLEQTTIETITINVVDVEAPFFSFDDRYIRIGKGVKLSVNDYIDILEIMNMIPNGVDGLVVDDTHVDYNIEKTYEVYVTFKIGDVGIERGRIILMIGAGDDDNSTDTDNELSWFDKIKDDLNNFYFKNKKIINTVLLILSCILGIVLLCLIAKCIRSFVRFVKSKKKTKKKATSKKKKKNTKKVVKDNKKKTTAKKSVSKNDKK